MLGVVPGTLFLKLGSPWIIKVLLGVFIIGLGIEMATRDRAKPQRPNALARTLISFASGFMAGLFGINLLFLAYMERIAEKRQQFRTNVCFVFLIENIFRTITYLYNGMFSVFTLQITAISVPAAIIGLAIGGRIDRRIDEKRAKKAVSFTGGRSFSSANQTVAVSVRCYDEAAESGWVQQPANKKILSAELARLEKHRRSSSLTTPSAGASSPIWMPSGARLRAHGAVRPDGNSDGTDWE